jgi:hypothetical protein
LEFRKTTGGLSRLWFRQHRRTVAAIGAVLLVGALSVYTVRELSTPFEERAYENNYEPFANSNINGFELAGAIFAEAEKQYEAGDFEAALALFRAVPPNVDKVVETNFYIGLSLMEVGQHYMAEEYFTSVISSSKEAAHFSYWYLGLCQLKQDHLVEARSTFSRIADYKLYNYEKAKRLVRKIARRL